MLGIRVGKGHASNEAIRKNGQFSVNVPGVELLEATDYCGITSARREDKSDADKIKPFSSPCLIIVSGRLETRSGMRGKTAHGTARN